MNTEGVRALVLEVIGAMVERSPTDLDEHVTRRVCERIEADPRRLRQYNHLCAAHGKAVPSGDGKAVVNTSIGWWTKRVLRAESVTEGEQVAPGTTSLIQSYTTLRYSRPKGTTTLISTLVLPKSGGHHRSQTTALLRRGSQPPVTRSAPKSTEPESRHVVQLVLEVRQILEAVHSAMPTSEFCGVGILVCSDASALPMCPLGGEEDVGDPNDIVRAICNASMRSNPNHDGFHVLSSDLHLTHTNQYIAPPLSPGFVAPDGIPGFGARHMSALLASRLEPVACAAVLNTQDEILVFADGRLLFHSAHGC